MTPTREEIQRRIDRLPDDKLPVVLDILALVSGEVLTSCSLDVLECMLMSSSALSRETNTQEEDAAWSYLREGT